MSSFTSNATVKPCVLPHLLHVFLLLGCFQLLQATELTILVLHNKEECFYEKAAEKQSIFLEFQVVTGGNNDVDLVLFSPSGQKLYAVEHEYYGQWKGTASESGTYRFCFSNRRSSHFDKRVYFDFMVGDEDRDRIPTDHATSPLTLVEASVQSIHDNLNVFMNSITHWRISASGDRIVLDHLKGRVSLWSLTQLIFIVIVCFGQVFVLRSFFH